MLRRARGCPCSEAPASLLEGEGPCCRPGEVAVSAGRGVLRDLNRSVQVGDAGPVGRLQGFFPEPRCCRGRQACRRALAMRPLCPTLRWGVGLCQTLVREGKHSNSNVSLNLPFFQAPPAPKAGGAMR